MNITDPNAVRFSPSQMTVKYHCPANRKQTGLRQNQSRSIFAVCFDTGKKLTAIRAAKNSFFTDFQDVSAHCYCASLMRTLFIRHALPCHVFEAHAPSRNSTKYRADDLCVNFLRIFLLAAR